MTGRYKSAAGADRRRRDWRRPLPIPAAAGKRDGKHRGLPDAGRRGRYAGQGPYPRRTGVASVRKTEMPRWLAAFLWDKAGHMLLNGIWRHTV